MAWMVLPPPAATFLIHWSICCVEWLFWYWYGLQRPGAPTARQWGQSNYPNRLISDRSTRLTRYSPRQHLFKGANISSQQLKSWKTQWSGRHCWVQAANAMPKNTHLSCSNSSGGIPLCSSTDLPCQRSLMWFTYLRKDLKFCKLSQTTSPAKAPTCTRCLYLPATDLGKPSKKSDLQLLIMPTLHQQMAGWQWKH